MTTLNFMIMARTIFAAILLICLYSCEKFSDRHCQMREQAEENTKDFSDVKFDSDVDLVCNMPLSSGVADTLQYNGKTYGFCSAICISDFKSNPRQFVR